MLIEIIHMGHTLIIETQAETDYQLLLGLAQRLGLRVSEAQTDQIHPPKQDTTKRPLGTMKGSFQIAPDFDEPLDDLKEYMQ